MPKGNPPDKRGIVLTKPYNKYAGVTTGVACREK